MDDSDSSRPKAGTTCEPASAPCSFFASGLIAWMPIGAGQPLSLPRPPWFGAGVPAGQVGVQRLCSRRWHCSTARRDPRLVFSVCRGAWSWHRRPSGGPCGRALCGDPCRRPPPGRSGSRRRAVAPPIARSPSGPTSPSGRSPWTSNPGDRRPASCSAPCPRAFRFWDSGSGGADAVHLAARTRCRRSCPRRRGRSRSSRPAGAPARGRQRPACCTPPARSPGCPSYPHPHQRPPCIWPASCFVRLPFSAFACDSTLFDRVTSPSSPSPSTRTGLFVFVVLDCNAAERARGSCSFFGLLADRLRFLAGASLILNSAPS